MFVHLETEPLDRRKYLVGGLDPFVRFRLLVVCVDERHDVHLEFGDVAERALGDRSRWPEIARLNGLTAERPHRLGQCLELPG